MLPMHRQVSTKVPIQPAVNDTQAPEVLKKQRRTISLRIHLPGRLTSLIRLVTPYLPSRRKYPVLARLGWGVLALFMFATLFFDWANLWQRESRYVLSAKAQTLLASTNPIAASKLQFDAKTQSYSFNKDYTPASEVAGMAATPKFTGSFDAGSEAGATINDPVTDTSITFKPDFDLQTPQQQEDRLVYPIQGRNAVKVYSMKSIGMKEDIILNTFQGDTVSFAYKLELPDGTEARMERNGSLAIYGVNPALLGNVTTGTDKDADLLHKARKNAQKNTLLYTFPAPFVREFGKSVSTTKAWFEYHNGVLTIKASGLAKATYPLSLDPSVYLETAAKLMRGNNETNVDFDVSNELIQKSQTTGARIDAWSSTSNLTTAVWGQGTAVAGGYIYSVGGSSTGNVTTTTYNTAGSTTYNVPAGVTSVTVKAWGGGGGGGGGNGSTGIGGNGGGGGYAKAVISVTPLEALTVEVGTGGAKGASDTTGGNGGGYSAVKRSATYLVQAGGGGGGGGARGTTNGGNSNGGAGGGTSGVAGSTPTGGGGGGGAGTTSGGTAGAAGGTGAAGIAGAANAGGNAPATVTSCATATSGTGGAGGTGGGGRAGTFTTTCANGGGGGGGRFGGGGGGSTGTANRGGGGGGGGSSLTTGIGTVETAGSGQTPGNNSDSDRGNLADGGTGAASAASATAGDNGIVLISYVTAGSITASVYWAKFNPNTNAIDSPNPGNGACTGWCNDSAYDLPAALTGLSLVAYNGYLYAIGGSNSGGTPQTTVYIAKLGANGEPQLWHPSGGTAVYWYTDTALSNARSYFGAVAYNNRMYILGGLTTSSTLLSSNTVQYADITPTGTLTSWTATGMQALTSNRYGLTAQVYNDTVYVIGGNTAFSGTPITTVQYSRLNSDGTMNAWQTTSSLLTFGGNGRQTMGGSFSTIWGGYIYVGGGCSAVDSNGRCTSIATDVQLASINADGSLASWNTILNLDNTRIGYTLIAWQGGLYRLGGCRFQDTSSGACSDTVFDVDYGVINPDGDASTVATSQPSGSGACTGGTPSNCDLPGTGNIGNILAATAIMNGYLYIVGGCTNNGCSTISSNVAYVAIGSDGLLSKPSTCPVGAYQGGMWCVDTTDTISGGIVAAGVAIFNGRIYLIGGQGTAGLKGNVYSVSINSDGSLAGAWTAQTFTNIAATSVSYTFAYARANPASAATYPGNIFIFGGCEASGGGIGCTTGSDTEDVFKCNVLPSGLLEEADANDCTTSGQLQIGTVTGASGAGLGLHAGTVYANYIYLIGGVAPGASDLKTVRYAKFDNSNNVVGVTGTSPPANCPSDPAPTGTAWVESCNQLSFGRRRGASFGYNGHIYVVGGFDASGGGVLADIQFAEVDVSDGSLGVFDASGVTINQRWGLSVPVSNSYAFVIGGCTDGNSPTCNSGGPTDTIQTFQVYNNDSGAPIGYAASANQFGTDRYGGSSTILNGYIYVAGGCTSKVDCTSTTNSVQYAALDSYGAVGSWSAGGNLPASVAWGQLEAAGGTLYYVGGQNSSGTAQTAVYYTSSITTGNPTWATASNGLPSARSQHSAAVWDNRIYVTGGFDSGGTTQTTVYISPRLSSGGDISSAWNSTSGQATAFNVARSGHTTIAYANNLYVLGGYTGSVYLSDVQFASMGYKTGTIAQSGTTVTGTGTTWTSGQVGSTIQYDDGSTSTITGFTSTTSITVAASKTVASGSAYTILDGSVGAWTYTTSLPTATRQADGFAANGYMYLVGGRTSDKDCSPSTLVAPISANTTIATGNNPTGLGEWYETNRRYTGDRYGGAVSYTNGKIYTLGGACSSTSAPTVNSTTTTNTGTGFATDSTTHAVSLPGTTASGDLLLMFLSTDDNSTVTGPGGGWTQIGATGTSGAGGVSGSIWAKVATGSDGATATFTTSATQSASAVVYRILAANWTGDLTSNGIAASTAVTATTGTAPDPAALNPAGWDIENTLWFAYNAGGTYTASTLPANYTNSTFIAGNSGANGASTAAGYRSATVASEDPGAFTMTTSSPNVAFTVAVRPPLVLNGANSAVQTAVYSQPQVAKYSRMIDTDTDVFPNSWLLNGLDNSIGARWQVKYRSMHDTSPTTDTVGGVLQQNPNEDCGTSTTMPVMTTWGQETNFGDTTLGHVETYTPKNSSGSNINCARFYYFSISIDASQTFGYPEDVNRGPTITDISLFFTSDPSKRLRHGKTFTGGELQPLDTPCRQSNPDSNAANCPLP